MISKIFAINSIFILDAFTVIMLIIDYDKKQVLLIESG
jgi:hypothetical protein